MRTDPAKSIYQETATATTDFNRDEIRKMRVLTRRMRFLESQVESRGGLANPDANGGAAFAELELDALEFVLKELGFVEIKRGEKA